MGRRIRWAYCGEKRKGKMGGLKEGNGVWVLFFLLLFSFYFLFNPLLKNLFKFSKKNFKPHNQTKAHAFNMMHNHLGIF
jgi:hypothetical protein